MNNDINKSVDAFLCKNQFYDLDYFNNLEALISSEIRE